MEENKGFEGYLSALRKKGAGFIPEMRGITMKDIDDIEKQALFPGGIGTITVNDIQGEISSMLRRFDGSTTLTISPKPQEIITGTAIAPEDKTKQIEHG